MHVKIVDNFFLLFKINVMSNIFLNLRASILSAKSQLPYEIGKILLREAIQISSAESCTGGLISSRLTDVSGSSA